MEFKHTLEILYNQAEEIASIANKLQSGQEIRKIEIDLLLEKLRNVYDLASDLRATIHFREDAGPASDQLGVSSKSLELVEEPDFEEDLPAQEEFMDPAPEPADETAAPEPTLADAPLEPVNTTKSEQQGSGGGAKILNEEISSRTKREDVASQYKLTPIASINSAIGINERFELINELFGGDRQGFDETMEVLNRSDSFVDAYNYLEENFNWDMDNAYVQRVLELIRRKLIVRRNEQ